MMGYNEVAKQDLNNLGDPFKGGRNKLRPLVPRPYLSPPNHDVHPSCPTNHFLPSSLSIATITTTTHHQHHNHNFGGGEEVKAETTVGTNQVMVSSRWNPTPEQLGALEELYRRGTRTPSADQIQHITSQLRRYGKIEGKNVFYWFQNHKARERQKRRRHLLRPSSPHSSGNNGNVGNKIGIETTEQKSCKWAPSSTNKESEVPIPIEIAETSGATKAETTSSTSSDFGCFQFHETSHHHHHHHKPLHNNNNNNNNITNLLFIKGDSNATWHTENTTTTTTRMVQTSSCSACSYPTPPVFPFSLSSSEPKGLNQSPVNPVVHGGDGGGEIPQSPTLQLFPVALIRDDDGQNNNNHAHNSSHNDDDDDDEMKKEEEEEEKSDYIVRNEKVVNMKNNPFPYYHFL